MMVVFAQSDGYVYETFGISKHIPVKLQLLLIRAETFDKPLTAKCFIYDVGCRNCLTFIVFSHKSTFRMNNLTCNPISIFMR